MTSEELDDYMKTLSPEEQEEIMKILKEISETGDSNTLKNLIDEDYEEIPVDIETFLKSPEYLGASFVDKDGRFSIYPFWVEKLKAIFENGKNKYNEVILTGGIGLGKSTIAIAGMCYVLYQIMCLKNPQSFYGLPPNTVIVFAFFNITLELSTGVAFRKINDFLMNSPWFVARGEIRGIKNKRYQPGKNIEFRIGSKPEHGLGQDIFCLGGNTKVKTGTKKNVKYVSIEELVQKSNFIYALKDIANELSEKRSLTKKKSIPTKMVQEYIKVTLADGTEIIGSENHKVLLDDGTFKELGKLTTQDRLKEIKKC